MHYNNNLISIIVPIYGVEKFLSQCIESIIGQTYTNLEIILVNDGSIDNCAFICDHYASLDNRIKVIHKLNEGLVSARKSGLKISTGSYIGYVDGDDWIEPEMYEKMLKDALLYNVDVVVAGHKEELNNNVVEVLYNNLPEGIYKDKKLENIFYPTMLNTGSFSQFGIYSYLWNKLFKREVLYKNQMAVSNMIFMAEDAACTYPTLLDANAIYISNSTHYRYRQRIDSMVKTRELTYLDIEKYNLLYHFLRNKFNETNFANVLIPQLDLFLLSLLTVRTELVAKNVLSSDNLYPFGKISLGSKIIIMGAGTFGQHLYHRIIKENKYKVVAWIDDLFKEYLTLNLIVNPVNSIRNLEYDAVLVAYIDESVAEKKVQQLLKTGAHLNKVFKVTHYNNSNIRNLLKDYGLNM
jgi:glycosyltransferase involved in cell wall biosynthesis